jgi:hypothetical protein
MKRKRIAGIPTIGARKIKYRSRLEAQWSYLFNRLGIPFEYEPYDLIDYIPDFIIKDEHGIEMLVEVKGTTCIDDLYQYIEKIFKSGWEGPYIVVGSCVWPACGSIADSDSDEINSTDDDTAVIGLIGTTVGEDSRVLYNFHDNSKFNDPVTYQATIKHCSERCCVALYDPQKSDRSTLMDTDTLDDMFSECKNLVQWKAGRIKSSKPNSKAKMIRHDCTRCGDTGITFCCDGKYGPCLFCDAARNLQYIDFNSECKQVITELGKSMIEHYE